MFALLLHNLRFDLAFQFLYQHPVDIVFANQRFFLMPLPDASADASPDEFWLLNNPV